MGGDTVSQPPKPSSALPGILAFAAVEIALYLTYFAHEARFHWFTHFYVGGSVALLIMAAVARRIGRPVPWPLLWPLLGHILAMFPDFLFQAGIAHRRWMDIFLAHLSSHFIPGRNWTWYAIWLTCIAIYLSSSNTRERTERELSADTPALPLTG